MTMTSWKTIRSIGVDFGFLHATPEPESIIYNAPRTIVNWTDGTKTVVKCKEGEPFDKYTGFLAALAKKVYGGHNPYKRFIANAQVQQARTE